MKELFKHSLVRITGIPFGKLEFSSVALAGMAVRVSDLDEAVQQAAEQLSAGLHAYNQSISDGEVQKKIQNIRRAVFKRKPLKTNDLNVLACLPSSFSSQINAYIEQEQAVADARAHLLEAVTHAFAGERRALQAAADNELLLKAISLASHSLYQDIRKYIAKDYTTFKSGEIHTEKSLLKYISRTCAKTSPFSTLTSLAVVPLVVNEGNTAAYISKEEKPAPETFVRLNNILLAFWKRLIVQDRAAAIHFPIHINPTITVSDTRITFLINKNNVDFFQRIPVTPVLSFVIDILRNKAALSIAELLTELEGNIDADRESITNYIFSCVESGLIEIDLLVTGIDPNWNTTLLERWIPFGRKIEGGTVDIICTALTAINVLCRQYGTTNSGERIDLGKAAFSIAEKASFDIWTHNAKQKALREQKPPPPSSGFVMALRPENIFMEDSRQKLPFELSASIMGAFVSKLADLYRHMDFFEGRKGEQLRMHAYFLKKYPGQSSVPLLLFYEDYYKDVRLRENAFNEMPPGDIPAGFELLKHISEVKRFKRDGLIKKWIDLLLAKATFSPSQTVVSFRLEDIAETNRILNLVPDMTKKHSVGAFVQCAFSGLPGKQECTGMVVNSLSAAYGKMFSRFLYLFDNKLTGEVKGSIVDCIPVDSIFAELQDASYHNANLHPTLMPDEIRIPGGHISLPPEHQYSIASLRIAISPGKESLEIMDVRTGKRIFPFDLGFQAPNGRSELFQLLCIFSYADYTSPQTLVTYINNKVMAEQDKAQQYVILPRVVYENNIVLQRMAWKIPLAQVPVKRGDENYAIYYARLVQWKNSLQIPDKVFVRAVEKSKRIESVESGKAGRDDYKPQYIDFNSILMVTLFEKLLTKAETTVFIEEMYPMPDEQLGIYGDRHVTEFYLQINDYGSAG